jgi:ubiquinone biosynthesis protein
MGSLSDADQYWLAENFLALFNQDYKRIAELHLQAGWMPNSVRMDDLEGAIRAVCEPYFTRPLSEISLAAVVVKLFQTARRYELTLQPQLILLQKTLLNIEGVGRLLHPRIDIWATARPVLEKIWWKRRGPRAMLKQLRRRIPEWMAAAPDMPQLVHRYLEQVTTGQLDVQIRSGELRELEQRSRLGQRLAVILTLAGTLGVGAFLLQVFDTQSTRFAGVSVPAMAAAIGALVAFVGAMRAR